MAAPHPSSARRRYLSQGKTTFHSLKKKQVKEKKTTNNTSVRGVRRQVDGEKGREKKDVKEQQQLRKNQEERSLRQPRRNRRSRIKERKGLSEEGRRRNKAPLVFAGTSTHRAVWEPAVSLGGTSRPAQESRDRKSVV